MGLPAQILLILAFILRFGDSKKVRARTKSLQTRVIRMK
jgi:hypothetical protein